MNQNQNNGTPVANTGTAYQVSIDDTLKLALKDAVAAVSKFDVKVNDLTTMYATDEQKFKDFLAEAEVVSAKIEELYKKIAPAHNILEKFKEVRAVALQNSLFKTVDRVEYVRATDGSVAMTIGYTTVTEESIDTDVLKEVCGVNVNGTATVCPGLWAKASCRTKKSGAALLKQVKDLIADGSLPATNVKGTPIIQTKTFEKSEIIFPGEDVYLSDGTAVEQNIITLPPKSGHIVR